MPVDPFVGQIMPAGFAMTPKNWAPCNGQLMSIMQNQALFSLLGTYFGGDGVSTFALPDLRGRAIVGSDFNTVALGQIAGTEQVQLTPAQMPSHTHALQGSSTQGGGRGGGVSNNVFGVNTAANEMIFAEAGSNEIALPAGTNIATNGNGLPHNNMQPYVVVNYMIALIGIYPPRS